MNQEQIEKAGAIFPVEDAHLLLDGPAGQLEMATTLPEENPVNAVAVIAHPHPSHGGSMRNKVVTILERSLRELGLKTVIFNFRGVGASEGSFGEGTGELEDLLAVINWVHRVLPDHALWLAGFSFGSWISAQAAELEEVEQLISIAPPVDRYPFDVDERVTSPWLVVQGEDDEVVPEDAVRKWIDSRENKPQYLVMAEAGHFFHRKLMDLRGVIKNGVKRQTGS